MASDQDIQVVNFYDELGLDRTESCEQLLEKLHSMKLGWQGRAQRAGTLGEEARRTLLLVAQASEIFRDADAKDSYDLSLIRTARETEPEEVQIDWLGRAWNYYFTGDDGAARVAVRRAREGDPNNTMAYVVSAWIHIRENEIKQAKQDADEAFVLDELGEDTADVHHVRGFAFHLLSDFENAAKSFRRALEKASDNEKPEILARLAWTFRAQGKHEDVLDAVVQGLSLDVEQSHYYARHLCTSGGHAVVALSDNPEDSAQSMEAYRVHRGNLQSSNVRSPWKENILAYVDAQIARHKDLKRLRDEIDSLERQRSENAKVSKANGNRPGIPFASIIMGVICLSLAGSWGALGFVGLVLLVVAGFKIYKIVNWVGQRNAYTLAVEAIEQADKRLAKVRPKIQPLTVVPEIQFA